MMGKRRGWPDWTGPGPDPFVHEATDWTGFLFAVCMMVAGFVVAVFVVVWALG